MALFKVVLRQAITGSAADYKWSNLWYVEAASVSEAADIGIEMWADALKDAAITATFCYEVYASDLNPLASVYTIKPMPSADADGTIAATGDLYIPSAVVRVDLPVASGRPSRKFHRPPLWEAAVDNGRSLTSAILAPVTSAYNEVLATWPVRDEDGNSFTGVVVRGLTTRRLGRDAYNDVPDPPA